MKFNEFMKKLIPFYEKYKDKYPNMKINCSIGGVTIDAFAVDIWEEGDVHHIGHIDPSVSIVMRYKTKEEEERINEIVDNYLKNQE